MSFKHQAVLNPEVEEQFKNEMYPLWRNGTLGKDIADTLQLGVEGTPYEKVKPHYIYYYRLKWQNLHLENPDENPLDFKPREKSKFSGQRYNVAPEELLNEIGLINPNEFVEALNEKLPYESFYCRRARSFLIVLYWTPLRSSEIYERTIDDFKIKRDRVIINLLRKKKRHKPRDKKEPITILREYPLVDELVAYSKSDEWRMDNEGKLTDNLHPWNISHDTARNYVKEIFEDAYPHFFRFRFLTEGASNPEISIGELTAKSRLTLPALNKYIKAPAILEESFDRKKLKKMKKEGLI